MYRKTLTKITAILATLVLAVSISGCSKGSNSGGDSDSPSAESASNEKDTGYEYFEELPELMQPTCIEGVSFKQRNDYLYVDGYEVSHVFDYTVDPSISVYDAIRQYYELVKDISGYEIVPREFDSGEFIIDMNKYYTEGYVHSACAGASFNDANSFHVTILDLGKGFFIDSYVEEHNLNAMGDLDIKGSWSAYESYNIDENTYDPRFSGIVTLLFNADGTFEFTEDGVSYSGTYKEDEKEDMTFELNFSDGRTAVITPIGQEIIFGFILDDEAYSTGYRMRK